MGVPSRARRLREEGWSVNRKRVQRLWREEGLRVPRAAQASAAGRLDRARRAAARGAAQSRVDVRLPDRPDRRRPGAEAAATSWTSSPARRWRYRVARSIDADRTVERARARRRRAWRRAGASEDGQRRRDDRQRAQGLVPVLKTGRRTSSPARRGRTRTSRPSTARCATSCSTSRSWRA